MNRNTAYWIITGLFCAIFFFGGTGHLLRVDRSAAAQVFAGTLGSRLSGQEG